MYGPQFAHWQLMAQHEAVLQDLVSLLLPLQEEPPHFRFTSYPLVRVEIPDPHVVEQEFQLPHLPHWQLTGQHPA